MWYYLFNQLLHNDELEIAKISIFPHSKGDYLIFYIFLA